MSDNDHGIGFQVRAKKMSQTPFRLLVVAVVLGTVALAGINSFGLPHTTQQDDSPLMQYKKLMMAFSTRFPDPSKISWADSQTFLQAFSARMLGATDEFTGSFDFIFKQQGAANPSAMSLVLATQPSTNSDPKTVKLAVKVKAKAGKAAELKKLLESVAPAVKIAGPDVVVEFPFPAKTQKEFVNAVKKDPAVSVGLEVHTGSTLQEIHASKEKNIVEAIKGLRLKGTFKMASALFGALADTAETKPPPTGMTKDAEDEVGHFMEGIASIGSTTTIEYKAADQLKELYKNLPPLMYLFGLLKSQVAQFPDGMKALIKKLPTTADGLSGATLSGGGLPKDLVLTATNFKPMALIADLVQELEAQLKE